MNEMGQSDDTQHRDDGWPAPHIPEQYGHCRDVYSVGQRADWATGEFDGAVAPDRALCDGGRGARGVPVLELVAAVTVALTLVVLTAAVVWL